MSFLALDAQKSLLTLQRNQLQLELMQNMSAANLVTKEMQVIMKSNPDGYDTDANYLYYEQMDEMYSTEKDSIESQITAIDNEISSLKTMVTNNIKNTCSLNLIGS